MQRKAELQLNMQLLLDLNFLPSINQLLQFWQNDFGCISCCRHNGKHCLKATLAYLRVSRGQREENSCQSFRVLADCN